MKKYLIIIILSLILISSSYLNSQVPEKTKTVEVEGVGLTKDKALLNAFRNAVKKAVGTLVNSETEIKNRKLIKKEVLTYSKGYVKTYDVLASEEDEGTWIIRIKALVSNVDLSMKLQELGLFKRKMDKGVFAEALTKIDEKRSASELVGKFMRKNFPKNAYIIKIGKSKIANTRPNGDVEVKIPYEISFNQEFIKNFENLIKHIKIQNIPLNRNNIPPSDCIIFTEASFSHIRSTGELYYKFRNSRAYKIAPSIRFYIGFLTSMDLYDVHLNFIDDNNEELTSTKIETKNAIWIASKKGDFLSWYYPQWGSYGYSDRSNSKDYVFFMTNYSMKGYFHIITDVNTLRKTKELVSNIRPNHHFNDRIKGIQKQRQRNNRR